MEILIGALLIVGAIIVLIGGIWFLIESFRESIWWGLGCFFISPVQLVFLILHWDVAKRPFGVQLLGFAMVFGSAFLAEPVSSMSY